LSILASIRKFGPKAFRRESFPPIPLDAARPRVLRNEGAPRSWRDPAGESPVQVRHSKSPGSECCVRGSGREAGHEAYTASVRGGVMSHEIVEAQGRRLSS